jgi:hypothetical protein
MPTAVSLADPEIVTSFKAGEAHPASRARSKLLSSRRWTFFIFVFILVPVTIEQSQKPFACHYVVAPRTSRQIAASVGKNPMSADGTDKVREFGCLL